MSTHPTTFNPDVSRFDANPNDLYITPPALASYALTQVSRMGMEPSQVLDPGCGTGVWGNVSRMMWPEAYLYGVEKHDELARMAKHSNKYTTIFVEDFVNETPLPIGEPKFDLVMGNPPYSGPRREPLAELFVLKSLAHLKPNGILIFLLKTEFLNTYGRYQAIFKTQPYRYVIALNPPRIPFRPDVNGKKTNSIDYSLFIWEKGWQGEPKVRYSDEDWRDF